MFLLVFLFCFTSESIREMFLLDIGRKFCKTVFVVLYVTFCYHCSCIRVNLVPWVFLVLLVLVVPLVPWVLLVQMVLLVKLVVM